MNIFDGARNKLFLAPLAGITDTAFRVTCLRRGADFAYTEMVSAKGINYGNKKTFDLLNLHEEESRIGVQLFGSEPNIIADTAKRILDRYGEKITLFDVNMGCPVPKVVNNGEGCALMQNPKLAAEIVECLKSAVQVPITVKFRKGFENNTAVSFAKTMESAGADAIAVHGRTRVQMYEGKADWDVIADVKRTVKIPVIGNGDIFDGISAKAMLEHTKCDALMIARGALGNPFIFREIREYLDKGEIIKATFKERLNAFFEQAELACREKGEAIAVREMRKHAAWYTKGVQNGAKVREKAVRANNLTELKEILYSLLEENS